MSEKSGFRYYCGLCWSSFESEQLCIDHIAEKHEDEIEEGENLEQFVLASDEPLEEEELSSEVIPTIEEEPDETTEVIDSKDLEEQLFALKIMENWDKLDETLDEGELKAELLSRFLGQEQGHDQVFERNVGTRGAFAQYFSKTIDHLRRGYCDFCGTDFEKLSKEINIKIEPTGEWAQHKELSHDELVIMLTHVKTKHPRIFEALREIFEGETIPEVPIARTSNPEQCSRDLEKLSKEQLAREIMKDESLYKRFLKKALESWNTTRE